MLLNLRIHYLETRKVLLNLIVILIMMMVSNSEALGKDKEVIKLEDKILYRFHDWELLNQALTHKSYDNEMQESRGIHYERLEFLGDSVLDMVSSHLLMKKHK